MKEIPTPNEEPDEADERYRRLSDRESSGPSEAVRSTVLRHAAELAAQVRAGQNSRAVNAAAAKRTRWRIATFGGLAAAAALSAILLLPHFLMAPTAPTAPMAQITAPTVPAPTAPTAQVTAPPAAGPQLFAQNYRERRSTSAEARIAPASAAAPAPDEAPTAAATSAPAAAARAAAVPAPNAAPPAPAAPLSLAASPADPAAALREAAQRGDVPALKRLLAQSPRIDARDARGRTALMLAVLHDQEGSVNILLAAGADPNAADASGMTPLQAALAHGRSAIAGALEQSGAR